jgi:hypothetical protein
VFSLKCFHSKRGYGENKRGEQSTKKGISGSEKGEWGVKERNSGSEKKKKWRVGKADWMKRMKKIEEKHTQRKEGEEE